MRRHGLAYTAGVLLSFAAVLAFVNIRFMNPMRDRRMISGRSSAGAGKRSRAIAYAAGIANSSTSAVRMLVSCRQKNRTYPIGPSFGCSPKNTSR